MALFEIRDLKVVFGEETILRDISFDIRKGEVVTIMGESGCGKSVLVKTLVGLVKPNEGSIRFGGDPVHDLEERGWTDVRQRIGMLFQEGALFDSMTVYDNIAYALHERGETPESEIAALVSESLLSVSLPGIEHMYPRDLSGGMQKRVALARAVVMRPEVVIYDEPTEGLDPINVTRVNRLMLRLRDRLGITSIIVTHNMQSAFRISDRLILIGEGQVLYEGTPAGFEEVAGDPRLGPFLESSRVTLR